MQFVFACYFCRTFADDRSACGGAGWLSSWLQWNAGLQRHTVCDAEQRVRPSQRQQRADD